MRRRKDDDRASGIAYATSGDRANENRSYTSVPVTAHDEKTRMLRGLDEPIDRWPLDDVDRQRDIVSIWPGHPVQLFYLSLLGSFPRVTGDRGLGQASMRVVSKGGDDLYGPTSPEPLLQSPLQRAIARRRPIQSDDDDIPSLAHDDLHLSYPMLVSREIPGSGPKVPAPL
jgi:hypothetical protein